MPESLLPKPDEAWALVQFLNPNGPHYVERMNSEGPSKPQPRTYSADDPGSFKKFVEANNSSQLRRNIYFLPNAPFLSGSRRKANVRQAQFLHVDLDCKDYPGSLDDQQNKIIGLLLEKRERPKGVPEPTAVWFTGGGYQAVWKLHEPVPPETAEDYNKRLLRTLQGGDGTHNVDRLLRLPGTINWLNDQKRSAGREPTLSFWMTKP